MAEFMAAPIWTPMAIYTGSGLAKPGKIPMRYDVANNKSLSWGFRKTAKDGKEASEAVSCAEVLEQLEDLDAMTDTSKLRGELRGFLRGYAQVPDDAEILHWEPSFHGGGKFGSFDLDDTLTPTGKRKKWAAQIMEASKGVRWFTTVSGKGVRGVFRMPSDPEEAARIRALCNTRNEKNNAGIGTIWGEFWSFSAKPAPEDKGGPIEWDEATLMAVVEHHGGLPKRKAKPGAVARVAHNREPWDGAPDFHFDRVCRWIDKTPQGIADALDATENTDQDIGWCFGVGRAAIEHLVHTTREREFEEDGTPIEPESLPTSAMDPAAWAIVKPALGRFLGRQPNPTPNAQRDLIKMVLAADVGGLWEFAGGTELSALNWRGVMGRPVATVRTPEEAYDRFVVIGQRFFDRHEAKFLDKGASGLVTATNRAFVSEKKMKVDGEEVLDDDGNAVMVEDPWTADMVVSHMRVHGRTFDDVAFMPGQPPVVDGVLNSYILPLPFAPATFEEIEPYWRHLVLLFGEDDARMLLDFGAFFLRFPGKKTNVAPVIVGPMRIGKDTAVAPWVRGLRGEVKARKMVRENVKLSEFSELHNGWVEGKVLLVVNERVLKGSDKAEIGETLKTIIAAPPETIPMRAMQNDTREIENVLNLVFLSNHIDGLFVENDDGRYWFTKVICEKPSRQYFVDLWAWLKAGGMDKVCGYLQHTHEIERVEERMEAAPSAAKDEAIRASLPDDADDILAFVEDREWVSTKQIKQHFAAAVFNEERRGLPTDRVINKTLTYGGFEKVDRITVRNGEDRTSHVIYARRASVTPSRDEIYGALAAGGVTLSLSQGCHVFEGVTDQESETKK
jgi:hypothetical protein